MRTYPRVRKSEMEEFLRGFLAKRVSFTDFSEDLRDQSLVGVKKMFDFYQKYARESLQLLETRGGCKHIGTGPLTELFTEELDDDQIWEQIQLMNEPVIKELTPVASCLALMINEGRFQLLHNSDKFPLGSKKKIEPLVRKKKRILPRSKLGTNCEDLLKEKDDSEMDSDLTISEEEEVMKKVQVGGKKSVVDDKFFKLSEMAKWVEMVEKEDERQGGGKSDSDDDSEEEEDMVFDFFKDIPSGPDDDVAEKKGEDRTKMVCFQDFFDPPHEDDYICNVGGERTKAVKFEGLDDDYDGSSGDEGVDDGEDDGDEDGGDDNFGSDKEDGLDVDARGAEGLVLDDGMQDEREEEKVSKHQKKKLLLQKRIATLEKINLAEKTWQMGGEASAKKRPLNSLLEEDLSVDYATRPAPVITVETTKLLEDMIIQRITDEAWDDVERRIKPAEKPFDYSRARPLEQEKSKLSLAEVYEQEYIKQTQEAEDEKEDDRHTEIRAMMKKLFAKLDALSNYHFTPKPLKPEVEIVTNVPAIQMEEVAPVATSDANLLAPEELQARSKRPEVGTTEKTTTDRKRERRLKKMRKRLQVAEKKQRDKIVAKLRPGLGNKYSKKTLEKKMKLREEGEEMDKSLRNSSRFFARLQEEVREQVKSVKAGGKSGTDRKRTAQQYKL